LTINTVYGIVEIIKHTILLLCQYEGKHVKLFHAGILQMEL